MKIKTLFLFIVLFVTFNAKAQYPYFNKRYESNSSTWSGVISIVELDEGFLIGGATGFPTNEYWHQITLTILDEKGDKSDENLFGDTISEYYVAINSLVKLTDNKLIFSGNRHTYYPGFSHDEVLIMKLDNEYDSLWTNYFGEKSSPWDTSYVARQMIETSNNKLINTGWITPAITYQDQIYLTKMNLMGNLLWEQFYTYPNPTYKLRGFSVIETPDKGFALGAYRFKSGYTETGEPMIYKTDSLGNEEWHIDLGGPFYDGLAKVCNSHDGNIMAAFCYADSMQSSDYAYRTINVQKIDLEGNVIWDKRYGPSNQRNDLGNIRLVPNGGYIITGSLFTADQYYPFPWLSGWMLKINNEGDSLWYRRYYNLNETDDRNYLYDVIPTADHGFAACGEVWGEETGNTQHAWAIKVDSMGCDTPGCATGTFVEEPSPSGGGRGEVLQLWPNPANCLVNVSFHNFRPADNTIIKVYDMQGIKVDEIKIPKNAKSIKVDVSKYPKGIYYLQYACSGKIWGNVKFIKN